MYDRLTNYGRYLLVFENLSTRMSVDPEPDDSEPWTAPVYDVRLDAGSDNNEDRTYRLFVRMAFGADPVPDFRYLLDIAEEHGLEVRFDNNGIELR